MSDLVLKIENVSKEYRLGTIGGGTLQGDLQSWWARLRHKEDPNTKIGSKQHVKNEKFLALDGVSLEVHKGDTLGVIGHNGAGKSTLLKLLSRVTAPTTGEISVKGRIASMLEVGTGFHPELTGRENIYMNGAILGMTKSEIDSKVEQIIDFSECRQFMDTPVKRYSSGMYVKLAFSVAAHLDSEIMVMDEVLAVGDMKFQQKCLGKMGDAASQDGRTVLYVSHNMNTIRTLCNRCIVLEHGKKIFDGDTEQAIEIYSQEVKNKIYKTLDLTEAKRYKAVSSLDRVRFTSIEFINDSDISGVGKFLQLRLKFRSYINESDVFFRLIFKNEFDMRVASAVVSIGKVEADKSYFVETEIDTSVLVGGFYKLNLTVFKTNGVGTSEEYDAVFSDFVVPKKHEFSVAWNAAIWGGTALKNKTLSVEQC